MKYCEKVLKKEWLAYNVVQIHLEKPACFESEAGDAVELKVAGQEPGPFTMTNLPDEDYLEFVIRIYKDHHGKTEAISELNAGDEVAFTEPFKTFRAQPKAVFVAGGTGITPFIAVMRQMHKEGVLDDCLLLFSNKTAKDVFLEKELRIMMGRRYIDVITEDNKDPRYYGNIDKNLLKNGVNDLTRPFLVCGPPAFNDAMEKALKNIGVKEDRIDTGS